MTPREGGREGCGKKRRCASGRLLLSALGAEGGVPVRASPCTTSGVSRMKGRRQWGASACSAPFALAPVSCKVGKGPGTPPTAPPPAAPDAQTRPFPDPAAARVTTPFRGLDSLGDAAPLEGHRRGSVLASTSRSSSSTGTSSPSDARSSSAMSTRGARVGLPPRAAPFDFPKSASVSSSAGKSSEIATMRKPNPTLATFSSRPAKLRSVGGQAWARQREPPPVTGRDEVDLTRATRA